MTQESLVRTRDGIGLGEAKKRAVLESLLRIVDSKTGIVKALIENNRFNDEPKMFQYTALMCNMSLFSDAQYSQPITGGIAFDREAAMIKALGEAVERYCHAIYRRKDFLVASYEEIEGQALDPRTIASFSKKQLADEGFKMFVFDETTKFNWVKGYSLTQNRPIYVPAQLVYMPYHYLDGEPIIRFPVSTGLAPRESLARALCAGICEVVERDAVMTNYYNMLPRDRIEIEESRNECIVELSEMFKRYGLELYVYDITTDIPIPSILSILVDRSGEGPTVIADAATDMDPEDAIITSIEAAQQARPWLRNEMFHLCDTCNCEVLEKVQPEYWLSTNLYRGLLWARRDMISNIDFLLGNQKRKRVESFENLSSRDAERNLRTILKMFEEKNMEVAYVDITTPDVNELGFKVVRVIIPELQPLHGDERFKYLGGRRLYEVPKLLGYRSTESTEDELNQIPHPFV